MEIPRPVEDKLKAMLGGEYEDYLESFTHGYGQTLRINRLKVKPADIIRRFLLKKRVPWCEDGFYYEGEERLSTSPYYHAGAYYLQEPSAMAPAAFLPVKPGDRILDLCAAPGGKAVALAGKLKNSGLLVANDPSASRCRALQKNVELAGIRCCVITCESPERLCGRFPHYFDGVLVDAPCSGEGMFRKEPAMMKSWSEDSVKEYSRLQREILSFAARMVKPGGYLLYSTCTFSIEEDEKNVCRLLSEYPDFHLQELPLYPGIEEGRVPDKVFPVSESGQTDVGMRAADSFSCCRRFWPHKVEGEGQFAALFKKEEESSHRDRTIPVGPEDAGTAGYLQIRRRTEGRAGVWDGGVQKAQVRQGQEDRCRKGQTGKEVFRRRKSGRMVRGEIPESPTAALEAAEQFLEGIRPCLPADLAADSWTERLVWREERLFLLPPGYPDFGGLRVVRSGLYLGDCRKGRFTPSQALAMALRPAACSRVLRLEESDPRLDRYLRGETISCSDDDGLEDSGYILICLCDLPLGWGKADRGRIKNKYLPGWRKM